MFCWNKELFTWCRLNWSLTHNFDFEFINDITNFLLSQFMHSRSTKKALSPVASTAILLCIAVAVSLATLAWMNGLPTSNMYTEELDVTSHQWGPNCTYIDVILYNNGTQSVNLKSVTVNSKPATVVYIAGSSQIDKGETATLRIANAFTPQETCQLTFQTAKGNKFTHTATP
jgi:hypothetical protein